MATTPFDVERSQVAPWARPGIAPKGKDSYPQIAHQSELWLAANVCGEERNMAIGGLVFLVEEKVEAAPSRGLVNDSVGGQTFEGGIGSKESSKLVGAKPRSGS